MRCYLFKAGYSLTIVAVVLFSFGHGSPVTDDEPESVIDVGVYYESLCPDSIRFFGSQLVPAYRILKNHLNIAFIPYGKASHWRDEETGPWQFTCQHGPAECRGNMAQACAINAIIREEQPEKIQDLTMSVLACTMASRNPPTAVPGCAEEAALKPETRAAINKCIDEPLSGELLSTFGEKTNNLTPRLTFVPTITINGAYDKDTQARVRNQFLRVMCGLLPATSKPNECTE